MESTSRFPQSLKIATRFPHPQQPDDAADGKAEKPSRFPTSSTQDSLSNKAESTCSAFGLVPTTRSSVRLRKIVAPERKILDPDQCKTILIGKGSGMKHEVRRSAPASSERQRSQTIHAQNQVYQCLRAMEVVIAAEARRFRWANYSNDRKPISPAWLPTRCEYMERLSLPTR